MNDHFRQGRAAEHTDTPLQIVIHSPFPEYLSRELEKRYQNVFCTLTRVPEDLLEGEVSAYIAFNGAEPVTIILYQRKARRITVFNEYLALPSEEVERMARHLFAEHRTADVISLSSVVPDNGRGSFPAQRCNASEDIVISLPGCVESYFSALGPNTRAAVRKSQKAVAARRPAIAFTFYEKGDVGLERIAQMIELSCRRLTSKQQVPRHDDRSVGLLRKMVDSYGITLVAEMEGQVVGGVICTQVGSHFYMHVVTHDGRFDELRLGMLCCYLSIAEAIRRGAREYHLLSGKYDYKFRFLGVQRDYDRIVIYRSLGRLLSNISLFTAIEIRRSGRCAKQQLISWRKKWKR